MCRLKFIFMIQIKELRIGNYISAMGKSITQVEGFDIYDNMILSSSFAERTYDYFEPIPLSKEWLLKFGAEEERGVWRIPKMKGYFDLLNLKGDIFFEYNVHQVQMCKLKNVHQLQNLYFTLTGEDLCVTSEACA